MKASLRVSLREVVRVSSATVAPETMDDELVSYYSLPGYDQHNGAVSVAPKTIKSRKLLLQEPVVLVSRLNPHIPRVVLAPVGYGRALASTEFAPLEPNGVELGYLLAFCKSENFRRSLRSLVTGTSTSHQRVKLSTLLDLEIPIADQRSQSALGNAMLTIENKRAQIRRTIKATDLLFSSLFREMFPDAHSGDREVGDFAEIVHGVSYRSADFGGDQQALMTLKNFARDGSFRRDGLKAWSGNPRADQVLRRGEVVVAHTDLTQNAEVLGRSLFARASNLFETLVASMDMAIVRPKPPISKPFLLGLFRQPEFLRHCRDHSNGTTVLHLGRRAVGRYRFALPPLAEVSKFTEIGEPILERLALAEAEGDLLDRVEMALLRENFGGR